MVTSNSEFKVQKIITDRAVGLIQDTNDFVATRAFPVVSFDEEYGSYPQYKLDDLLKSTLKQVGPSGDFDMSEVDLEWKTVELFKHGVDRPIADEKRKRMGGNNAVQDAADQLMVEAYRYLDKLTISAVLADASFDYLKTGKTSSPSTNEFLSFADGSSDPINDVKSWIREISAATGQMMDSIMITRDAYDKLYNHADLIGRVGQNINFRQFEDKFLAQLFGIQNVYVANGVINTANKGASANTALQATDSMLIYKKGGNSLSSIGAAKILYCNNPIYGGNLFNISTLRDPWKEMEAVRIKGHFMPVVTSKPLGMKIKNMFVTA